MQAVIDAQILSISTKADGVLLVVNVEEVKEALAK